MHASLRAVTRGLLVGSDVLVFHEREKQRSERCYVIRFIRSPFSFGGRGASASGLLLGTEAAVRPPTPPGA
jgi:hypothetical protein